MHNATLRATLCAILVPHVRQYESMGDDERIASALRIADRIIEATNADRARIFTHQYETKADT